MLFAACQNTIKYEFDPNDGKITILGQLSTADKEHSLFLSMSYPDRIDSLPDATVYCYVNGERHQATKAHPGYEWQYDPVTYGTILVPIKNPYTEYRFQADFKPGDKVRIEASRGNQDAWTELEVPQPGTLVSADTLTVVKSSVYQDLEGAETYEQEYLEFTVCLKDAGGIDNFYSLDAEQHKVIRIISQEGTEEELQDYTFDYDTFHDLVLEDGYSSGVGNLFEDLLPVNYTHCFSDKMFKDKDVTVKFYIPTYYIKENPYYNYYYEAEEVEVDMTLKLRFKSFDRTFYNYLRAINNMMCYGYDVNPIVEPTMLPNNVNGGMGMVIVAAESAYEIVFPTKVYHIDNNYYVY